MALSRGQSETTTLKQNVEDQLDRLVQQLADIEQCKSELEPSEYEEMRNDTLEQLHEFNHSLTKMKEGNLSLLNDLNNIQLAIQAAISQAFKTPEVIRMFAKKQPNQLRECLQQVDRNLKLNQISPEEGMGKKLEILTALKRLNEPLSPEEESYLSKHSTDSHLKFQKVDDQDALYNNDNKEVLKVIKDKVKAASAHS